MAVLHVKLQFTWLVTSSTKLRHAYHCMVIHVGFVTDRAAVGQDFLQALELLKIHVLWDVTRRNAPQDVNLHQQRSDSLRSLPFQPAHYHFTCAAF